MMEEWGHKSLFVSKFYISQVKILYLHLELKFGTIFTPRKTLVLETQFWVKFSIIFAPSPLILITHFLLDAPQSHIYTCTYII